METSQLTEKCCCKKNALQVLYNDKKRIADQKKMHETTVNGNDRKGKKCLISVGKIC